MQLGEEILRVREEFFLPGETCPANPLAEFVLLILGLELGPGLVPVHIDNHHIHRDIVGFEGFRKVKQLVIGVFPIAAPPVAECVFRRERNASGYLCEVTESRCVVVTVTEEV